ncbi:MAG: ribonuclease PH [bacterium]
MTSAPRPAYHRTDREPDQLRPITLTTGVLMHPEGSAEISFGRTRVLCTASVETSVPSFAEQAGTGWVTAEYAMLPRSTNTRGRRMQNSRAKEISRLVGRCLRQAVDLQALQGYAITVDCDVLQADGGTRTAAITGGYVALALAIAGLVREQKVKPEALREPVAAVSVGLLGDAALLDLRYEEDSRADVDLNVAMTGSGRLVELQGTAEGAAFSREQLDRMLDLALAGIRTLVDKQRQALDDSSPA